VVGVVATLQQLALQQHYVAMTLMFAVIVEQCGIIQGPRSILMHHRSTTFVECQLFGSYTVYMFRQHTRLLPKTFEYLCGVLARSLSPSHRCVQSPIPLCDRIAISLNRLSSGNSLRGCGEIYGIAESTIFVIVREFCAAVENASSLQRISSKFEALKGIPFVIGAVDGSHIPIIAPSLDPISYYCRKGFYLALLQGVVDNRCRFWDYDFGWAGHCHDWALF
jgi:hypothetical protein